MSTANSNSFNKLCQVCFVHDNSPNNEYCECIHCSITVHFPCYGLTSIDIISSTSSPPHHTTNKFICDACQHQKKHKNQPIKCCLCPLPSGALKRTSCGQWCHLFCALWIPEVGIANIITKSPIINLDNIPSHRKNKNCAICKRHKQKSSTYPCIKCEHNSCTEYIHPMCTTTTHKYKANLLITKNDITNIANNNDMVQSAINTLGPYLWYFLCHRHNHSHLNDINGIKRIEILKLLQGDWPYWKIHPNPIFNGKPKMDIICNDSLLLQALPTQKMIHRYENIIYSMHNMPASLCSNIGPIGLLQKRIKLKYDRNSKYSLNLNKTSQSLHWDHLQNVVNYDIVSSEGEESKEERMEVESKDNDINSMPLYERLKSVDICLSRNEVINLLWNSKEKFFNDISCEDYARISPYDYRQDPCFSLPLIGKPFFDKWNKTIKNISNIHHYNLDELNDEAVLLNQSMSLPEPVNYRNNLLIQHRLGADSSGEQIVVDFSGENVGGERGGRAWDGRYSSYLTKQDEMGWRWVLNRWKMPKHLASISCVCLQCKQSVDVYNKKYIEAVNEYKQIEKMIPKWRETEHSDDNDVSKQTQYIDELEKKYQDTKEKQTSTNQMDVDSEVKVAVVGENEPKILQFEGKSLNKIPVIIKSKYGKVLAHFVGKEEVFDGHNDGLYSDALGVDLGINPPPIYNKMNAVLEAKNLPKAKSKKSASHILNMPSMTCADETSQNALNALYGHSEPPLKRRKLNNKHKEENNESLHINDMDMDGCNVELDSLRNLKNIDILMENHKKDSLCKYLSDTVYDLYERMRSNDSIKHMIRTNLANKVKTKSMIQYEKLHEIVVKHAIEHSCIWLRVRTSLARGYSDAPGKFSNGGLRGENEQEQDEDYSVCTVCFDGSFSDDNPIVFCDECNVGLHRYCYGIIHVPGDNDRWYCDSCNWLHKNGNDNKPQCCLCPISGCALKQTKSGGFAHVACALWVNGIDIGNVRRMNPICGVLKVQEMQSKSAIKIHSKMLEIGLKINNGIQIDEADKQYLQWIGEWTHKCIVCGDDNGCFVECADPQCISRIHVLCGWFTGYSMQIKLDKETGSISCVIYCPKHTPLNADGDSRNLNYFRQIRGNGLEHRKNMLSMEKKRTKYQKLTAKFIRFADKYPTETCCICFTDYPQFTLMKCVKCNIFVHGKCYCIEKIGNVDNWQCDICISYPEYHKTLLHDYDSDSDELDVERVFNLECVECVLCPRRGGAFKQIEMKNNLCWIHVCCGQWIDGIRFNKQLNKFICYNEAVSTCNKCYLCRKQREDNDTTIQCQYGACDLSFHVLCGLFGDCYLRAHKCANGFEFKFYCTKHKYMIESDAKDINVEYKLTQHLLNIKRLRLKLCKIKSTSDRICEYELNQRGIINHTTASYKECGKLPPKSTRKKHKKYKKYESENSDFELKKRVKSHRKRKHRNRKRKRSKNDEYSSLTGTDYTDSKSMISISENNEMSLSEFNENDNVVAIEEKFTSRITRSHSKIKSKRKSKNKNEGGIQMATDIWAEQYKYGGGEIKWPVIKRNGWFMAIPRLKLPKSNKYRYSHLERKQKEKILLMEKEKAVEMNMCNDWNNLLQKIKEKEREMDDDGNYESMLREKYGSGGTGWELTYDLNQTEVTDSLQHTKICPYCKKIKQATMSLHNWARHLNAKHVFKCIKCDLYFTRHQLLTKHLEQCNQ